MRAAVTVPRGTREGMDWMAMMMMRQQAWDSTVGDGMMRRYWSEAFTTEDVIVMDCSK